MNIKKLISGMLALLVFAVPAITHAATLTDDGLGVNAVSNFTRHPNSNSHWFSSETAAPGDIVSFGVYYANRSNETAQNVTVRLSSAAGGQNSSYTLTGTVSASNANTISGPATITISSPQTLTWNGTANHVRNSTGQGTPISNPGALFSSGLNIGNVAPGEFGTVVVRFNVGNQQQQVVTEPTVQTNSPTNISQNSCTLNAFVNTNGNSNVTTFFEFGQTSSFGQTLGTQTISSSQNLSFTISNIASNTTFFYRAVAQRPGGAQVFGNTVSCTTSAGVQNEPTVQTLSPSNIQSNQATLNGFVNTNGNSNVNVFFEFGQTTSLGQTLGFQTIGNGSQNTSFTNFNLSPNTTYFYRVVAQRNGGPQVFGNIVNFTTPSNNNNFNGNPIVTTQPATRTNVPTTWVLNGFLSNNNSNQFSSVFFEYGETSSLGNRTSSQSLFNGSFSSTLANLTPGQTYFFRAVAQSNNGLVSQGQILNFTVDGNFNNGQSTQVNTLPATNVSSSQMTLNGQVFNNGSCQALTGFFEFGQTTNLGSQTPVQNIASGSSATFFRVLQNLLQNTTYFYRAVAQDSCGNIVRGNILSTRTSTGVVVVPPPPTVVTPQVVVQSPFILSFGYAPLRPLPGTEVTYRVGWKNDSDIRLNDALMRITLPEGITFLSTNSGFIRDGEKGLLRPIGNVARGASDAYFFTARIDSNVALASDPAMGIQMSFFNPSTGANGSVSIKGITRIGDGVSTVTATNNGDTVVVNNPPLVINPPVVVNNNPEPTNSTGLVFLGSLGDAFPKTVIGWVLLILAVVLLLAVIRHYFVTENKPKA